MDLNNLVNRLVDDHPKVLAAILDCKSTDVPLEVARIYMKSHSEARRVVAHRFRELAEMERQGFLSDKITLPDAIDDIAAQVL